jgi:putative ABC transport system permease protein
MLLKIVIRNLNKRLFLNFIKVLGLSLGLAGIIFIGLFLKNELSYDNFHTHSDRIYRLTSTNRDFMGENHFARIPNSEQVPLLSEYFPQIENYVRLAPVRGGVMLHNGKYYAVNQGYECDSTFFELFSANLLLGEKKQVLSTPGSMVISESFATKIFGTNDPTGEIISIPAGQFYASQTDFTVRGVMKDFPQTSHIHPELIATPVDGEIDGWAYVYLLLAEHTSPEDITDEYPAFLQQHVQNISEKPSSVAYLQKITEIHLHSDKLREMESNGNMSNIYVLAIAALILLLISMSNYASLNLGMAGLYIKFIAISRISGASNNVNLRYFIYECLLILAATVAMTAVMVLLAQSYILKNYRISLIEGNFILILYMIFLFIILGLFSGLQPYFLQQFNKLRPSVSENSFKFKTKFISKGIIVPQFMFAMMLLVAVLVITLQTRFALSHSMGERNGNIICFESVHADVQQKFEHFKSELLKYNSIESVTAMLEPPGGEANDMFGFELEGRPEGEDRQAERIGVFPCDYSFPGVFNLEFLGGNSFSKSNSDAEGSGEYIINEAAMHELGFSNPEEIIGKGFRLIFAVPGIEIPRGSIIGVVRDFHLSSMKKQVNPLVMFKRDKLWLMNFVVAYKPAMKEEAIADLEKVWDEMFPAYPFYYEPVDVMYQKVYQTELLQARLLSVFTVISLFICSIGLLGLSLLTTQQRIKEIGIRKVNGAGSLQVLYLLNRDFMKWVIIAFALACPIAWYAMDLWLEGFAYRISLSWWIFLLAGTMVTGTAFLAVSWQSWKAATMNPVEELRYE